MIYTASYFQKQNHKGDRFSISLTEPKGFQLNGKLWMFVPSENLLKKYKNQSVNQEQYLSEYREICKERLFLIKPWLEIIKPEFDVTLLCWERKGEFCHRNLVYKFIEKYRPDCLGQNN
jgi:uncharacterized protein YeaO (DUF488 family)